ncbi:choice-of-anchor U domain-containing protein [Acidobacteriota bacterium]
MKGMLWKSIIAVLMCLTVSAFVVAQDEDPLIKTTGACCLPDGSCTDTGTFGACGGANGTWQGDFTVCGAVTCPQPGACCFGDGSCLELVEIDCTTGNGTFEGEGTDCTPNDCEQPQACCFDDGTCNDLLAATCTAGGGTSGGVGTDCASYKCPVPEACCVLGAKCADMLPANCTAAGGTGSGDGTLCAAYECDEACCPDDGSGCQELTPTECTALPGTAEGAGTECATTNCPTAGACCNGDGDCKEMLLADCNSAGFYFQGEGTTCPNDACNTQACCKGKNCKDYSADKCIDEGATGVGPGTACADIPDPCTTIVTGACCGDGDVCTDVVASNCTGYYAGDGTDCKTVNCDDGDGVTAAVENGAPNNGDGNNDGTDDAQQGDVTSLPTATGNGYATIVASNGCTQLENVSALTEGDMAELDPMNAYPYGLFEFQANCDSMQVTLILENATDLGADYRKYGPEIPGDMNSVGWYDVDNATAAGNTVGFPLQDGVKGDDTGVDGTIYDQGGPPEPDEEEPPVPAIPSWIGLFMLMILLLGTGTFVYLKR